MKYYLIVGFILLAPLFVFGQIEYKEEKTKINSIKKNANYIYGEGFASTAQEASDIAEMALRSEVMRVVSERKKLQDAEAVVVNMVKKNTSQVLLKRGAMDRVFLYVDVNHIFPSNEMMTVQIRNDEPLIEAVETNPLPMEETLSMDVVELAAVPEATVESAMQSSSGVINDILQTRSYTALLTYLKGQKENHKVMYGEVASDLNPAWYIIAIEGDRIKAVFDKGLSMRLNFLTGEKESIGQYSKCKKIWIISYE